MSRYRIFILSICSLFAFQAFAGDLKSDLKDILTVNQRAFTQNDLKKFMATTTASPMILDEFPPFTWSGKNSATTYVKDFKEITAKFKMTDFKVEVKDPTSFEQTPNAVYAVFPITVNYKDGDMKIHTDDGFQTVVFKKSASNTWLIEHSAWTITNKNPK